MPYDPTRHGPQRVVGPGFRARVFAVVRRVPRGKLTTYGDVGQALGLRSAARHVGFALAALDADDVPWHRVVNSRGRISLPSGSRQAAEQRRRLRAEGVRVGADGTVAGFAARRFAFGLRFGSSRIHGGLK